MKLYVYFFLVVFSFLCIRCNSSSNDTLIREIKLTNKDSSFLFFDTININQKIVFERKGNIFFCYIDSVVRENINEIRIKKSVLVQNDRFYLIKDTIFSYKDIELRLMFINYNCGSDCSYLLYFSENYGLIKLFYNQISYEVQKIYFNKNNVIIDIANLNNLIEKNYILNSIPPLPPNN